MTTYENLMNTVMSINVNTSLSNNWKANLKELLAKWLMFLKEDIPHYVYCFVENQKLAIEEIKKAGVDVHPLFNSSICMDINAKQCANIIQILEGVSLLLINDNNTSHEVSDNMRDFLKTKIAINFDKTKDKHHDLFYLLMNRLKNLSYYGIKIKWNDGEDLYNVHLYEIEYINFSIVCGFNNTNTLTYAREYYEKYQERNVKFLTCEEFFK